MPLPWKIPQLRNSTYVEIKSGLEEGDTVYYTEAVSNNFGGFGNMGFGGGMPNFGGNGGQMPNFGGNSRPGNSSGGKRGQ